LRITGLSIGADSGLDGTNGFMVADRLILAPGGYPIALLHSMHRRAMRDSARQSGDSGGYCLRERPLLSYQFALGFEPVVQRAVVLGRMFEMLGMGTSSDFLVRKVKVSGGPSGLSPGRQLLLIIRQD
jgi:hypothetical protein